MKPQDHPLRATLDRVNALNAFYHVALDVPADQRSETWFTIAEVLDSNGTAYNMLAQNIVDSQPKANRRYIGMRILSSMAWSMALMGLGCFLMDRRVPQLAPSSITMHWRKEGWADITALMDPSFYVLADDPAAAHPNTMVAGDEHTLRDYFRHYYETVIAAMLAPIKARSGLGKAAVWACAADQCVALITNVMQYLKQYERCEAEVAALVRVEGSPLNGRSGILWVDSGSEQVPCLNRGCCCLWYMVAEQAKSYCLTCPLRPREDRIDQLRTYLASQAHE